jgi:hypothetical protein
MNWQEAEAADNQQAPAWGRVTGRECSYNSACYEDSWSSGLVCALALNTPNCVRLRGLVGPLSVLDFFAVPNTGSKRRHCFFSSTRRTKLSATRLMGLFRFQTVENRPCCRRKATWEKVQVSGGRVNRLAFAKSPRRNRETAPGRTPQSLDGRVESAQLSTFLRPT